MGKTKEGVKIVKNMPRSDFYRLFVQGAGQTRAFGALVSFGAKNLASEEKVEVRASLSEMGIPPALMLTDGDLDDIAAAAAARSITLS